MTAPGTLVADRYRLVERIAAGGMGWVWEAWDELLHRKVAMKQLLPQPGLSTDDAELSRRRVIREARITARLHHPHVVTLFDVVEHDGCPCLIMQYVPSRSLNALLQDSGVLPEAAVLRIGAEVSAGLAAAHDVGIVHRDVKPGNVLITEDGSAKLTDFGISHAVGDPNLTATGMVTGTPAYLAPEVARGGASGFPADVFSFGATLYAALEGYPPFGTDPNPMAVLHRAATGRVIPPQRSGGLTPLLSQMLAADPGDRPTMADVASTLSARQTEMSGMPDLLQALTVAIPPRTIREWPAETAAVTPGPWQGLLGAAREPEPVVDPPPPTRVEPVVELTEEIVPRRTPPVPLSGRRRWGWPVVAALIALLIVGAIIVGLSLSDRGATAQGTGPSTTTDSAPESAPSSTSAAAPASTSAEQSAGVATSDAAPTASTPLETPSTASVPQSSLSSPESAPPTSEAPTGEPTAAELVAFVTDYYAAMPGGTDQGWGRLTSRFQNGIAQNRDYYELFWGSIKAVDVNDISASPPGTVEATITYHFEDSRVSVERTVYSVVREGGALKIDNSEVV
ncbi:MAG: protein kinase [Nakamurella sp.]